VWPVGRLEGSFLAIEQKCQGIAVLLGVEISSVKSRSTLEAAGGWWLGRLRHISESVASIFAVASPPIAARLNEVSNATPDACLWPR
jgi:hypothetical protein